MTFTRELPTAPGFYAWRRTGTSQPIGAVVIDNGKFLEVEFSDASWGRVERTGGEWCRLVPAEEIEKAYREGFFTSNPFNDTTCQETWNASRAKRVMEGKE